MALTEEEKEERAKRAKEKQEEIKAQALNLWARVARLTLMGKEHPDKVAARDIGSGRSTYPFDDKTELIEALVSQGYLRGASTKEPVKTTHYDEVRLVIPDHRLFYILRFEESKKHCKAPVLGLPNPDRTQVIDFESDGYHKLSGWGAETELYVYWHLDEFDFFQQTGRFQYKDRAQDVIWNNLQTIVGQCFNHRTIDEYLLNDPRFSMDNLKGRPAAILRFNADRMAVYVEYFKIALTSHSKAIRYARRRMIDVIKEHMPLLAFLEIEDEEKSDEVHPEYFKYIAKHMDLFTYEELYGGK